MGIFPNLPNLQLYYHLPFPCPHRQLHQMRDASARIQEEEKENILDEVKDVDKWNQWVDAAEKEAIKEDQEEKDKEYVDTKNRIFYGEELKQIDEAQKKTVSGTNYITKVSNKQVRQTTNPEDSDQT